MVTDMIQSFFDCLNKNSGAIQALSTVLLVIITALYAKYTWNMSQMISRQVLSEIKLSHMILGSPFLNKVFELQIKDDIQIILKHRYYEFTLLFDIKNRSSANGSIDKPILVLNYDNNAIRFRVYPKTQYSIVDKQTENMTSWHTEDTGGTIKIAGCGSEKIELNYVLWGDTYEKNPVAFAQYEMLINRLKKGLDGLEYFLEYSDNLDNDYFVKINQVQPEEMTHRV
jgi:hypothetical protein